MDRSTLEARSAMGYPVLAVILPPPTGSTAAAALDNLLPNKPDS
jgi:hypothetical protein